MEIEISQRPPRARSDLRDMLRDYLIGRSLGYMAAAQARRMKALESRDYEGYRDAICRSVKGFYRKLPAGADAGAVEVREVSGFERAGYRVENVLFDSYPGYAVNASVYLPTEIAGPWPGVVIPVGHSGKQFASYQFPAQFFARSGYAAVLFDPPGQAGEKREGNDHFVDGVRCYLVGENSSQYFVADALRCVDYLFSRGDIDTRRGVAMTGVSGGGTTTTLVGLLDDRVRVLGPSCCLTPLADLDIQQCYCGCPETHMWGRYREGIDEVDLLCAAVGKAMLLMAGRWDSVFRIEDTRRLADEVRAFYAGAGAGEPFDYYEDDDPRGHCYSLNQARAFTAFMNKHLRDDENGMICELGDEAFELDDEELLRCNPPTEVNMRSLTLARAEALANERNIDLDGMREAAGKWVRIEEVVASGEVKRSEPFRVWTHLWEHVLLTSESGIEIPGTLLYPIEGKERSGAVLHFDDKGHNRLLESGGMLARAAGFLDEGRKALVVLSVDLRGWGDTEAGLYPYEMASWGSRDRYLAYTTAALGDGLMGMRIRDGLTAYDYLRGREEVDENRIVVTGGGLGAMAALHVAMLKPGVAGVVVWDGLCSFHELLKEACYQWSAEAFVPNILCYYDMPELTAGLECRVAVVRARDGRGKVIGAERLGELNRMGAGQRYYQEADVVELVRSFVG